MPNGPRIGSNRSAHSRKQPDKHQGSQERPNNQVPSPLRPCHALPCLRMPRCQRKASRGQSAADPGIMSSRNVQGAP